MTLYRATQDGQIPMTPEEEAEFEASRVPPAPTKEQINAPILAQLAEIGRKRERPMTAILLGDPDEVDGKTALERLVDLESQAIELRAQLVK